MIEPKLNQLEQKGNAFLTYVIKVQEEKIQNAITSPYLLPLPFLQVGPVLSPTSSMESWTQPAGALQPHG